MLSPDCPADASACTTWALWLPSKLMIFAYLVDIDRLSTRANLFYKNCAPSAVCVACPDIETGRHIFFDCPPAVALWSRLGIAVPMGQFSLWDLLAPVQVPTSAWRSAVVVLLWSIWKARNDRVFNGRDSPLSAVVRRACGDLAIWHWRFKADDRAPLDRLRSYFLACVL
jgi:hypothetical protein